MRMLHFSADKGTQEAVWFTDGGDQSSQAIMEELDVYFKEAEWLFDWEVEVSDMATPAVDEPYFKEIS